MSDESIRLKELKNEIQRRTILSEKIIKKLNLNFEIPNYIIEDIINEEEYSHICLMINMAVVNSRISEENGDRLKEKIKEEYNISNLYDRIIFD